MERTNGSNPDTEGAIEIHDREADTYDAQAAHYLWHGHEILFGLWYGMAGMDETAGMPASPGSSGMPETSGVSGTSGPGIAPGAPARLLDVGIGTGLGSELFARAGWEVHGFDGGERMLALCAEKGFAADLREWDLRRTPWPYADAFFAGVVCCGVLHFFGDLAAFFTEVARVTAPGGWAAFTTKAGQDAPAGSPGWTSVHMEGVEVAEHGHSYIRKCLENYGMAEMAWQPFHAGALDAEPEVFVAHVARKLA